MKRTGPTNQVLKELIENLNEVSLEQKVNIWKRVADDLNYSARRRREVNLFNLDKNTKEGEIVVVPGKVLGVGELTHGITVAAFKFSESALDKINANGKAMTIQELVKENPKGNKIRIIG